MAKKAKGPRGTDSLMGKMAIATQSDSPSFQPHKCLEGNAHGAV